jgi:diphthamide synthase subunit DPH2
MLVTGCPAISTDKGGRLEKFCLREKINKFVFTRKNKLIDLV